MREARRNAWHGFDRKIWRGLCISPTCKYYDSGSKRMETGKRKQLHGCRSNSKHSQLHMSHDGCRMKENSHEMQTNLCRLQVFGTVLLKNSAIFPKSEASANRTIRVLYPMHGVLEKTDQQHRLQMTPSTDAQSLQGSVKQARRTINIECRCPSKQRP